MGLLISLSHAGFHYFDPTQTDAIPQSLSEVGIFSDINAKILDTALKFYEINTPLWSDGAIKQRWIILPPGRSIPYNDTTDLFDYPDSVVFVKNFQLEKIRGDSSTRTYWETRLLVNHRNDSGQNNWYGFSYHWNADASNAFLVDRDQGFDTLFYAQLNGVNAPSTYIKWHFPSQSDCNLCHSARKVLGFLPPQLKRTDWGGSGLNQIQVLFAKGVFSGTLPTETELLRHWKGIHEPDPVNATPEQKFAWLDTVARSYLAANCSGCHGDRGISQTLAPATVNFDFYRLHPVMELAHVPTVTSHLEDSGSNAITLFGRRYLIVAAARAGFDTSVGGTWDVSIPPGENPPALLYPGYPAYSTFLYRQLTRRAPWRDSSDAQNLLIPDSDSVTRAWLFSVPWGTTEWKSVLASHGHDATDFISFQAEVNYGGNQMPPINTSYFPDVEALARLGAWVKSYPDPGPGGIRSRFGSAQSGQSGMPKFYRIGRRIEFLGFSPIKVVLLDMRGRSTSLDRGAESSFFLPAHLRHGIYVLWADGEKFRFALME